jgi:hypothetical protein
MKTLFLASTTLALLAAINPSPAMAQKSKPAGGNTWPGITQRLEPGASTIAAATPRYEFQYGYDKHARWRGHWVLATDAKGSNRPQGADQHLAGSSRAAGRGMTGRSCSLQRGLDRV